MLVSHCTNRTLHEFDNAIKSFCFYKFAQWHPNAKPCVHSVHVNQRTSTTSTHANTDFFQCYTAVWLQNKPVPSRLGFSLCKNHVNHSLTFRFQIPDFTCPFNIRVPTNQIIFEDFSAALPNLLLTIFFFSDGF